MDVILCFADITLNEGKPSKRMLVIKNSNGTLLVDEGLYSISFEGSIPNDVLVENIEEIIPADTEKPFLDEVSESLSIVFKAGYRLAMNTLKIQFSKGHTSVSRNKIVRDFINDYFKNNK